MIVQFRNEKVSNHGSIPITIDCNFVTFIVFEEGFHQPIKRTKQVWKRRRLLQRQHLQRRRDWGKLKGSAEKIIGFKTGVHNTRTQNSAWMNSALFSEWYSKDYFIPNVEKLCEREGKTGKVLLILDNAPCHLPVKILKAIDDDFSVMYFPPNVTALVQPMDQGVIEKLKRVYRKQVLLRLLLAVNDWDSRALEKQSLKNAWHKLWPDLEAKKDFNDDHREEITDFFNQSQDFKNAMKRRCRNLDGMRCRKLWILNAK
ncbi:tigger transposable element-derived protein 2 [Trichonephila clavipes]|nr:tigger transposable element-derived protein 2 [Trichonephila clavipes]